MIFENIVSHVYLGVKSGLRKIINMQGTQEEFEYKPIVSSEHTVTFESRYANFY